MKRTYIKSLTAVFVMLVVGPAMGNDKIYLRNGNLLVGNIISETRDAYKVVTHNRGSGSIVTLPYSTVRYVLYGTAERANRALKLDKTARKLSARDDATVTFLQTEAFGDAITSAAQKARKRIWIMAYFITGSSQPTIKEFFDTLREKAHSGVDVWILSEFGKATAMPIRNATRNFAEDLAKDDIRIGFIQEYRVQHKKVILIDDDQVFLGSSNLTAAGTSLSEEMNVFITSKDFAEEAERDFLNISKKARSSGEIKY